MTIRPNSIEAAAAALSKTSTGPVLLIETSNQGSTTRYGVMSTFSAETLAELQFRDIAIEAFATVDAALDVIRSTEAAFDEEPGTCFATRISTFEGGSLIDIIKFGQDLFCEFEEA